MACDNRVITLDLVDLSSEIQGAPGVGSFAWNKVGIMYIFKDYSDVLHVTVSLNATFRPNRGGPVDPVAPALSPSHFFVGQYMHAQPAAGYTGVGVGPTVGAVSVWDAFNLTLVYSSSFGPYTNLLQPDVFSGRDSRLWSCFTYSIDLKNVCNPSLTEYRTFDASNPGFRQPLPQGPGCYAKGQPAQLTKLSGAPFTRDLSNITNGNPLIAQMQFTVTKFSMTPGCSPSLYAASAAPNRNSSNIATSNIVTGMSQVSDACGCADLSVSSPTITARTLPQGTRRDPFASSLPAGVPNNFDVNDNPSSSGLWPASTIP
ncbi:uncharacterized protein HaLaN_06655, partial [Haematococcus lacustris]